MRISCREAIAAIREYLRNEVTYPFLVAANTSSDLREIAAAMPDSVHTLAVSKYCVEDGMPDEDALFNDLVYSSTPLLIKGVGEMCMLSGGSAFIQRIAGQTFSRKIVILCREQGLLLNRLFHQNSKFGEHRWCETEGSSDISIVRVNSDVPIDAIKGIKALMRILEEGPVGKIYVSTDVEICCSKVIASAYDAIRDNNPSFVIPESALHEEQWTDYLRNNDLSVINPLHWRYYLKCLLHGSDLPYFQLVMQHSPDYEAYCREVVGALLHVPYTSDVFQPLYQERKMLLRQYPDIDVSEYIRDSLEKDVDRIHYLTDNTIQEKHAIIEEIARHGLRVEVLEEVYPALAAYFSSYSFSGTNGELLTQYFKRYKIQKALNRIEPDFLAQVVELSKTGNRKYNSFQTRDQLILQMKKPGCGLYWIDALGVEYIGLIKNIAKDIGLWIEVGIGRSYLPTLTEFNKAFYDNWTGFKCPKEERLDKVKHEGVGAQRNIDPAIHLADEIAIIRDALVKIKDYLTNHRVESFLLVSDHGASRLCVLNQHENRWRMAENGKHSGRCCPINQADECPDSATQDNGYWVLANYDRFKGGRQASVEVHGGASLEEVLIPVIRITLASERIDCHIRDCDEEVGTVIKPLDGPTVLKLYCSKASAHISLIIKGKTYQGIQRDDNPLFFDVDLNAHEEVWRSSQTYDAIVNDGDNELTTLRFKIQRTKRGTRNDRDGSDFFGT